MLQEGYYEATLEAAKALASIGELAVLPLLGALQTMRGIGLRDAILALEWIGDPPALPALEALSGVKDVIEQVGTSGGVIHVNMAAQACERIRQKHQQ